MRLKITDTPTLRYSAYHYSHPTLTERLKALEAFQAAKASRKGGIAKKEL